MTDDNIQIETWNCLAKDSQDKSPFLIASAESFNELLSQSTLTHIIVKKKITILLPIVHIVMTLMVAYIGWSYLKETANPKPWILIAFAGLACFFIGSYFSVVLRINKIHIDLIKQSLILKYGISPYQQQLEIPLTQLKLKLYNNKKDDIGTKIPGHTILSLYWPQASDQELILATSEHISYLQPAYTKLHDHFLDAAKNTANLTQTENGPLETDYSFISQGIGPFYTRELIEINNSKLNFKLTQYKILPIISAIGLAFISFATPLMQDYTDSTQLRKIAYFAITWTAGILCISACLYYLIKYLRKRCIIVDKTTDTLTYSTSQNNYLPNRKIINLSDIQAVQTNSMLMEIKEYNTPCNIMTHELNIYSDKLKDKRINISCSDNKKSISYQAKKLANFLHVPLIDHLEK